MDTNLLARIANPQIADPTGSYLAGATAGNALRGYSNARSADMLTPAAMAGDKNALAQLSGVDYGRASAIDTTRYERGRQGAADTRAAAAETRTQGDYDRKVAAEKAQKVAGVLYDASTPEAFESAKQHLAQVYKMDVSQLRFEDRQSYVNDALTLAQRITADKPIEVSAGATLTSPAGKPLYTAPANPGSNKPTEAAMRNAGLYSVASPELKTVKDTWGALANVGDQALNRLGLPGNVVQSAAFQRAISAVETIAQSYLYSASGQAAPAEEVAKIVKSVTPAIGDKPPVVADKLVRIENFVNAIKLNAGNAVVSTQGAQNPPPGTAGSGGGGGAVARPTATNPQTGEKLEFDGQRWVPVQ